MRTASWVILGAVLGVTALLAADAPRSGSAAPSAQAAPQWRETNWPFLMDQWGQGRAFACDAADCGTQLSVYLRAKIGFCNCTTGVADDDEIDRVADVSLFDVRYAPLGTSREVTVGWMKGRARQYQVTAGNAPQRSVLAVAFADRCDVLVATAVSSGGTGAPPEQAVLAFLNTQPSLQWAKLALGL
jgi:hypothetical protein